MRKYRVHVTAYGKMLKLPNGELRRTPTRFILEENQKNSGLAILRRLALKEGKDYNIEEISSEEAEDMAKKKKSINRDRGRSLKTSNQIGVDMGFKMKG